MGRRARRYTKSPQRSELIENRPEPAPRQPAPPVTHIRWSETVARQLEATVPSHITLSEGWLQRKVPIR